MELDPNTEAAERKAYKKETFAQAFARNRKAGEKKFVWRGEEYSTEMAKPTARSAVSDTYRKEGEGRMKPPAPPSRSDATKMMADRAASGAQSARTASETRATAAREAESEMQRESRGQGRDGESTSGMGSKITNRPAPGARSIYEDLDLGKVAGAAGAIASAYPAGRLAKTGIDALKAARAARAAKEARPRRTDPAEFPERAPRDLVSEANRRMRAADEEGYKKGGAVKSRGNGCARKGFGKGTMR